MAGIHTPGLYILTEQLRIYEQLLKHHTNAANENIINKQKDINREFKVPVESAMRPTYAWCTAETGRSWAISTYEKLHANACGV